MSWAAQLVPGTRSAQWHCSRTICVTICNTNFRPFAPVSEGMMAFHEVHTVDVQASQHITGQQSPSAPSNPIISYNPSRHSAPFDLMAAAAVQYWKHAWQSTGTIISTSASGIAHTASAQAVIRHVSAAGPGQALLIPGCGVSTDVAQAAAHVPVIAVDVATEPLVQQAAQFGVCRPPPATHIHIPAQLPSQHEVHLIQADVASLQLPDACSLAPRGVLDCGCLTALAPEAAPSYLASLRSTVQHGDLLALEILECNRRDVADGTHLSAAKAAMLLAQAGWQVQDTLKQNISAQHRDWLREKGGTRLSKVMFLARAAKLEAEQI